MVPGRTDRQRDTQARAGAALSSGSGAPRVLRVSPELGCPPRRVPGNVPRGLGTGADPEDSSRGASRPGQAASPPAWAMAIPGPAGAAGPGRTAPAAGTGGPGRGPGGTQGSHCPSLPSGRNPGQPVLPLSATEPLCAAGTEGAAWARCHPACQPPLWAHPVPSPPSTAPGVRGPGGPAGRAGGCSSLNASRPARVEFPVGGHRAPGRLSPPLLLLFVAKSSAGAADMRPAPRPPTPRGEAGAAAGTAGRTAVTLTLGRTGKALHLAGPRAGGLRREGAPGPRPRGGAEPAPPRTKTGKSEESPALSRRRLGGGTGS